MTTVSFKTIKIVGHAHDYYITQTKTKRLLWDMFVQHTITKDGHHNLGNAK